MNKLFSKVATLSVGLAMAIGVGVAVGSRSAKVARADSVAEFTLSSASDVEVDGVTASFAKGSGYNAPAWYDNGLRLYVSNTVTISSESTITGVTFNWEQQGSRTFNTVTANVGNYTHPSSAGVGTWSGEANEIVFTCGTTSKAQLQLNTFSVTYSGGTSSTYTVTYDANGGTGSMSDETEYSSGDTVTVKYCAFAPADSFHEFDSFNTMADGSGTRYLGGGQFSITKNTTLYAQWKIKDVTLSNGSYSSAVSYVNPMPKELDVKDSNLNKVGLLEVDTSNVTYKTNYNYKEFDIAANKSLTIKNHSNAVITVVSFEVYNFDNIDVFVDGNTEYMHHGNGSNIGDHTKIELNVNAENTVEIKCNGGNNGSRSQSFYGFEVLMKVGSEVIHPSSVELNAESGNVYIGKTKQLTATVLPADADDKTVSWSSDNTAVATVADGLVTGVAAGTATITVTTNDGGLTATFVATVKELSYGTLESPLSVEEARDVLDVTGSSTSAEKLYVTGVVYSSSYDTSHSNYTIWLKNSEGTVDKYFELYGTTISNAYSEIDFTSSNALKGLTVVCYGYGKIYNTTYELTFVSSDYPEIQVISYTAEELAAAILADTKAKCDAYVDKESSYDEYKSAFESVWAKLSIRYSVLSESDKSALANADRDEKGTVIEQAMARYDFLTGKYELSNFISGRTPMSFVHIGFDNLTETNNTMIIVISIAAVSALAFTMLLVFKKKKQK